MSFQSREFWESFKKHKNYGLFSLFLATETALPIGREYSSYQLARVEVPEKMSANFWLWNFVFSALIRAKPALLRYIQVMYRTEADMKQPWSLLIISESKLISAQCRWDLNQGEFESLITPVFAVDWHNLRIKMKINNQGLQKITHESYSFSWTLPVDSVKLN